MLVACFAIPANKKQEDYDKAYRSLSQKVPLGIWRPEPGGKNMESKIESKVESKIESKFKSRSESKAESMAESNVEFKVESMTEISNDRKKITRIVSILTKV